ncbi:hypothetical protein BDW60DRAFT_179661 [Aspergillus nidulans var. acristatus]
MLTLQYRFRGKPIDQGSRRVGQVELISEVSPCRQQLTACCGRFESKSKYWISILARTGSLGSLICTRTKVRLYGT